MSQQDQNAPPSTWSKTKGGFSAVGKGAGAARTGINSGLTKLDNISVSKKGLSFKKEMSGQNVTYDRDNHVSRPKTDVSHLPPPPRRIPGQVPAKTTTTTTTTTTTARPPATSARPAAPAPGSRPSPPVPQAPRPGARLVPPPPATAAKPLQTPDEPLPVYTPTTTTTMTASSSSMMGDLSSRMNQMRASPAPIPPKPSSASQTKPAPSSPSTTSGVPSMNEAKSAFASAKTVGTLYGKYGGGGGAQQAGQKTPTPSWTEVKAGASAAHNLHSLHSKYAPQQAPLGTPGTTIPPQQKQTLVAPTPVKPAPLATQTSLPAGGVGAAAATRSPKPPLPKGKPGVRREYCIGLYSFDAQADGDLSFGVGDKIEVLERTSDPDAWWRGKLNGQEGIFPGNYCRLET